MINLKLLKEENNQIIYLKYNGSYKKGIFMWFHNGNIEIFLNKSIALLSINPANWNKLSLTGIEIDTFNINY